MGLQKLGQPLPESYYVIDNEYCHELMDKFENNAQLHQKFDSDGMVFTQINIQKVGFNRFFDASVRFGGTDPIGIGGTLAETGKPNPFFDNNPYVKVLTPPL